MVHIFTILSYLSFLRLIVDQSQLLLKLPDSTMVKNKGEYWSPKKNAAV